MAAHSPSRNVGYNMTINTDDAILCLLAISSCFWRIATCPDFSFFFSSEALKESDGNSGVCLLFQLQTSSVTNLRQNKGSNRTIEIGL